MGQMQRLLQATICAVGSLAASPLWADAVTEWDVTVCQLTADAKLPTPPANRLMAIVQTSVFEAANAITHRYAYGSIHLNAAAGASLEAAVAAANHAALLQLLPAQQAAIEMAYQSALAGISEGAAKTAGIAVGESAAAAVLAARMNDGAAAPETYRPATSAGVYVPTVIPAVPQWPQRKPWLLSSAAQFRPAAPPALTSKLWARDFNESKLLGARHSTARTAEQTQMAQFWETTGPQIYHGVLRSVANAPGRDLTRNARLFAMAAQATDDAVIAVFDAKYTFAFWRPITAIRNGDIDGNDATERDASWQPFIDTPLHPEYPCAHCIVAGAIGTVLRAEVGSASMPTLTTTSPTAQGAARSWSNVDDFMQEVANARIYDGVHFRNSAEVGTAMGRQIGELAVAKWQGR